MEPVELPPEDEGDIVAFLKVEQPRTKASQRPDVTTKVTSVFSIFIVLPFRAKAVPAAKSDYVGNQVVAMFKNHTLSSRAIIISGQLYYRVIRS